MNRSLFFGSLLGILFCAGRSSAQYEQYEMQYETSPAEQEGEEPLSTPAPDAPQGAASNTTTDNKMSLPYTPYPAGLSWVLTPQSFRVPIPDRIYYPPHHYVRKCPYYPRGYYWGANWRFNVIGRGNLLFCGTFRYNPYLTAAIAQHHPDLRGQRRYAPPPGPVGQAMLLGSTGPSAGLPTAPTTPAPTPPASMPLPPTVAGNSTSAAQSASPAKQATVRKAAEKRPAHTGSSRRTAQPVKLSAAGANLAP